MDKQYKNSENRQYLIFVITIISVMVTMILGAFVFKFYKQSVGGKSDIREYDKYYCLITDNYKSDFWQSVYEGALEAAKEENIYVDLLGSNLPGDYSTEDLMKIAISVKITNKRIGCFLLSLFLFPPGRFVLLSSMLVLQS